MTVVCISIIGASSLTYIKLSTIEKKNDGSVKLLFLGHISSSKNIKQAPVMCIVKQSIFTKLDVSYAKQRTSS